MNPREQLMQPLVEWMPHEAFPVGALVFLIVCIAVGMVGWAAGRA